MHEEMVQMQFLINLNMYLLLLIKYFIGFTNLSLDFLHHPSSASDVESHYESLETSSA